MKTIDFKKGLTFIKKNKELVEWYDLNKDLIPIKIQ